MDSMILLNQNLLVHLYFYVDNLINVQMTFENRIMSV